MAKLNRPIVDNLIFHSDRGVQYACNEFKKQLESPLITQSMSRKGNCWDNAVAESFFKSLKKECIYRNNYLTRKEAELSVFQWIEMWYNTPPNALRTARLKCENPSIKIRYEHARIRPIFVGSPGLNAPFLWKRHFP